MFLFPIPQSIKNSGGTFDYSSRNVIKIDCADPLLTKAVLRKIEQEKKRGRIFTVTAGTVNKDSLLVELCCQEKLSIDEYQLSITACGAEIVSGGAQGLFYGFSTFLSILEDGMAKVPEMEIEDVPDLIHRGYMLDISRCKIPKMDSLKKMIDVLAELRCNELQLYMEHSFAYPGHERVWAEFSPMTAEEILELDIYCRERFIELVPNQNSFGHMERWLKHPEYDHLAENTAPWYHEAWDMYYKSSLHPSEESLAFLRELYDSLLPNFSSENVNIGCDETFELGSGRSAERCKAEGKHNVYLDFLNKICSLAGEYGKNVQFWGDIILEAPELISKLPKDITAMSWGYEDFHDFKGECGKFAEVAIPFYVCPGTSAWNTFIGRTANMLGNIASACREGSAAGAKGMLITDWGDSGHHQYWPISWPGIVFGMACAWNPQTVEEHTRLLPEAVGRFFDPAAKGAALGAALMELGDIYKVFPRDVCRNSAPWCSVFYNSLKSPLIKEWLSMITPDMVKEALKKLKDWHKRFVENPPTADETVLRELANGVLMTRCGLEYLLYRLGCRIDRNAWHDNMAKAIAEHEYLWLCRNRCGGLHESSRRLRELKERVER